MKRNFRWFLLLLTFLSYPFMGFAQQQNISGEVDEEWVELGQLGVLNRDGTISPFGNNHQKRLQMQARQKWDIDQTTGNRVGIEQRGSGNSAEWFHEGYDNSFDLDQIGDHNVHQGVLIGDENSIRVEQFGNRNRVSQDLAGDRMELEVIQHGNNHEFDQIEKTNGNSPAYQIHQQGNHGMKVKIQHEKSY